MLLSVSGASGGGKSTALDALAGVSWGMPIKLFEFDSIGVPADADTGWRHGAVESWVQRALREQERGNHVLLFGQVPYGELLAAPSADRLNGIAACTLDCSPEIRRARLRARGDAEATLEYHVSFGEWFRGHSVDPQHRPEVIRVESTIPMRWERWDDWLKGDPRWAVRTIDTDLLAAGGVGERVESWAREVLSGTTEYSVMA